MIPLKEHNNIVERLMKQLQSKQQQIKNITKEKTKAPVQAPQLQPTNNEQLLTKKINQLNKQHKERVNILQQQIRNKSVQNKDLKERLIFKQNMEAKQKEHISQILKKTYDRKPSSGADYKISALVSHYDSQLEKKTKFIETLQKKIRTLQESTQINDSIDTNQNYKTVNSNDQAKGMSLTDHQRQMTRARTQIQKFKKLFDEKDKEYRDLSRRYSELTNEYYKIVNSYGIEDSKIDKIKPKSVTSIKSDKTIGNAPFAKTIVKPRANALQNLLEQMIGSESQPQEVTFLNKKTFSSRVANIPRETAFLKQQDQTEELEPEEESWQVENSEKDRQALMKVEQIMQQLQIDDQKDIIPRLLQLKISSESYNLLDTIARSLQAFFYNIGKGKIKRQDLVSALQDLQVSYNRNLEAVDILDEVCIQAGAKRDKLLARVKELTEVGHEYHSKLKSIKFMQDLAKGNKVIQFINFFELDRQQLALPQQLLKIQEQLKSIDKFVKECKVILEVNQSSSQEVLQLVLRYLQKTTSLVSQLQKKKPKAQKISE